MCKAHILMQSSPSRWEESKPIALFFYSSLVYKNLSKIICLFEALREMSSVTISFFQRCLLFLIVRTWLFSHRTFFFWSKCSLNACFKTWFMYCHCAVPELPIIFTKCLVFNYYYIFYFPNEELSLIQKVSLVCTF